MAEEKQTRIFHFNGDVKYYEAVTIYNSKGGVVNLSGSRDEEVKTEASSAELTLQQRIEGIGDAVDMMFEEGLFKQKQDYAAVRYMILDAKILDSLPYTDFIALLKEHCAIPEEQMPTDNNIKRLEIKGTHPNWRVIHDDVRYCQRVIALGETFLSYYHKIVDKS